MATLPAPTRWRSAPEPAARGDGRAVAGARSAASSSAPGSQAPRHAAVGTTAAWPVGAGGTNSVLRFMGNHLRGRTSVGDHTAGESPGLRGVRALDGDEPRGAGAQGGASVSC